MAKTLIETFGNLTAVTDIALGRMASSTPSSF